MHGLNNLGNTCGVNSLLQCIAHSPVLHEILVSTSGPTSSGLHSQLADVIRKLCDTQVAPHGFLNALHVAFKGLLVPGEQQDIVELWMLVVDKIAEEVGVEAPVPVHATEFVSNILAARHMHNNRKESRWIDAVQGTQLSVIECSCGFRQANVEVFTNIAVNLPPQASGPVEVTDLLREYFAQEPLGCWKCDQCKSVGRAVKQNVIVAEPPPVLIVSLKRFTSNGAKINVPVEVAEYFQFKDKKFKLMAIGQHHGVHFGGHYVAICRRPSPSTEASAAAAGWCLYDDEKVYNIGPELRYERTCVYFLIYERE